MPYQLPPDVQDQVSRQIATGHYASEDEVLRAALRALTFRHGELPAIRAGIEDMEACRLHPFDDFDADLRKQFGFAADR